MSSGPVNSLLQGYWALWVGEWVPVIRIVFFWDRVLGFASFASTGF